MTQSVLTFFGLAALWGGLLGPACADNTIVISDSNYGNGVFSGYNWVSTGLGNGTMYFYRVRAVRGSLYGAYSSEVSAKPVSAPSAPTGVSATAGAVGSKSITVKWTGSSSASGYTVYRASSSGGTYSQISTATGLSYVNTGLTAGTTYFYKVAATNAGGSSPQAGPASAKAQ